MRSAREILITMTAWAQAYEQHWKQVHNAPVPTALAEATVEAEEFLFVADAEAFAAVVKIQTKI